MVMAGAPEWTVREANKTDGRAVALVAEPAWRSKPPQCQMTDAVLSARFLKTV
jgi:hypothetical protein